MGADGHIRIYDLEKIEKEFGKEVVNSFFDHFGSSIMYRQTLQGRKYLTRYWGDNLYSDDLYDMVLSCYNPVTDLFYTDSASYDSYSGSYFMKLSKDQRIQFNYMIEFIEEQCRLTAWEVWT
jgi:hypothetical protein